MRLIACTALATLVSFPALADELEEEAVALFEAAYPEDQCWSYYESRPAPQRREFTVEGGAEPETVTTFEFTCVSAAYNVVKAVLVHTQIDGLRVQSFAYPAMDITYEGGSDVDAPVGPVERIEIVGYGTKSVVTTPVTDEETGQIVAEEKWRGIGDAGTSGTWELTSGGYILTGFEIDATYNGEIDPVTVLKAGEPVTAE
ncbi:hypothetical protein [Tropicimonas sp. IMCC34011]|uniref:hypothetical protein n=1 Tax=Tropicimonas sp. IMCC34011 TaxID=2248759 RepID=UPI000E24507B|nr:hypothetical protein [Tropicimonas sp. IMCC34011]